MENTKVIHKVFYATITIILSIFCPFLKVVAVEGNTSLEVNVNEALSVTVTTPENWAIGNIDEFLRNPVSVEVSTNNSAGYTATMSAKTTQTSLVNTSKSTVLLPTLATSSVTRGSFPANYWGYSLDDTVAGSTSSHYYPMVASNQTPITILQSNTASSGSRNFYFGAKGDATLAAGTYVGTVVINVVTGVIDNDNPVTPVDPVTPGPDAVAEYDPDKDITTYTRPDLNCDEFGTCYNSTTTQISRGDNRNSYQEYAEPEGVTYSTKSNLATGVTLATGFGIAASIAATSGFFFLAAARNEGDDDEEDESQQ